MRQIKRTKSNKIFRFVLSAVTLAAILHLQFGAWTTANASGRYEADAPCDRFGVISSNTTWSPNECSAYTLTGSITVNAGSTLTILPGTIIKFTAGKALSVRGQLLAIGTPENNIVFTSNSATPARGDWDYIEFVESAVDAQFGSDGAYVGGSALRYAVVEYAGTNYAVFGRGAIRVSNSSPWIDHTVVRQNKRYGIHIKSDTPVRLTDNVIEKNTETGVVIEYTKAIVRNNLFSGNEDGGLFVFACEGASIENNIFSRNKALDGAAISGYFSIYTIYGNTFVENAARRSGGAIRDFGRKVDYRNNLFVGNEAVAGGAIYLSYSNKENVLEGNAFINNRTKTNPAQSENGGGAIFASQPSGATFRWNEFSGNTHDGVLNDIKNVSNNGWLDIIAENNWWNTVSRSEIADRIIDYSDNTKYAVVDFEPFLTQGRARSEVVNAAGKTLSSADSKVSVQFPAGSVSGNVTATVAGVASSTAPLPAGRTFVDGFRVIATNVDGSLQQTFNPPLRIQVSYSDSDVGGKEESLNLAYFDGTQWVNFLPCAGCVVDTAANTITVVTNHLTEFAVTKQGVDSKLIYLPIIRR